MKGPQTLGPVEAGFTLLEMLVVLAILAVVVMVTVPHVASPRDGLRLEAASAALVSALRLARGAAIARKTDMVLVVDVEERTAAMSGERAYRFDSDIAVELRVAAPEQASKSRGAFRFFSDGSSTGGDIILRAGRRQAHVCVDWLTGRARQEKEC